MRRQTILLDSDGLLYLAGFVGETVTYWAVMEDDDGNVVEVSLPTKTQVNERVAELTEEGLTLLEDGFFRNPPPLEHCLAIIKRKIEDTKKRYGDLIEVYIKGDGTNFRNDIATIHGYKANRTALKPYWFDDMKNYLVTWHNAIEVHGKEADDAIATRAYELAGNYVVASPDKDLDQIPGLHWNYSKNVEYMISPDEAERFFWIQVLTGDYADNIRGCWQCGYKTAEALVDEYIDNPEALWDQILLKYEQSQQIERKGSPCPYAGLDPYEVALENARLVWMQTEPGRLWTPPGEPKEYMEADLDD